MAWASGVGAQGPGWTLPPNPRTQSAWKDARHRGFQKGSGGLPSASWDSKEACCPGGVCLPCWGFTPGRPPLQPTLGSNLGLGMWSWSWSVVKEHVGPHSAGLSAVSSGLQGCGPAAGGGVGHTSRQTLEKADSPHLGHPSTHRGTFGRS